MINYTLNETHSSGVVWFFVVVVVTGFVVDAWGFFGGVLISVLPH